MTPLIELDALTKRYGNARGIEDVSMTVERGEVFGFLGPNGAGKTTTIRTLLDLLHPTSGSARVFGLDSRADRQAIHARLGNLPGERVVTGVTMGTAGAMYVIDLLGKLAPAVEPLRAISAFRYYGSAVQDGIALAHVLGLTLAGVALAALGAALFERRDMR
jgi:ABC-type phosphate/phosphonate transport system ATPase subunit